MPTPIVLCVPSKIQTRQWFVTNYSNTSCLDTTVYTENSTIFNNLPGAWLYALFSFRSLQALGTNIIQHFINTICYMKVSSQEFPDLW